jgi:hypothetical protein
VSPGLATTLSKGTTVAVWRFGSELVFGFWVADEPARLAFRFPFNFFDTEAYPMSNEGLVNWSLTAHRRNNQER